MRLNNTEAELLLAIITGNTNELKQGERTEQAKNSLIEKVISESMRIRY